MPARPVTVTFQVVADNDWMRRFSDPNFWNTYKLYVIREITEGAAATIRSYASRLWKNPTGALDQSWFTTYDAQRGIGSISNSKPYAYWLNYGVRPHKMTYLLNADNAFYFSDGTKAAVIPLVIGGQRMFRIASYWQMIKNPNGPPWFHTGIEPKYFMEAGMQEYRDSRLRQDYRGLLIRVMNLAP